MPAAGSSNGTPLFVGPYQLLQRIGAGGFAEIFRARHRDSGEQVAVKVLRADASQCTAALDDFTHEIDMLKKLDVKGVPRYIAEGSSKGRPALVMELIQGHPIHNMIFENIMFDKVTALVEMIKIVAKVHSSGILHNDLKPENFMLAREGRVYLVDFGNAGFADTKVGLLGRFFKRRRSIFGTPAYMAPELVKGGQPTYRTDVYALGACAHFVLTGKALIEGSGQTSKLRKAVEVKRSSVSERISKLPRDLTVIIDRACSADPDARPFDAQAMSHALSKHFGSGRYRKPSELSDFLNTLKQQEAAEKH